MWRTTVMAFFISSYVIQRQMFQLTSLVKEALKP